MVTYRERRDERREQNQPEEVPEGPEGEWYYDGRSGKRTSKAEREESARRVAEAEALEGAAAITWLPIRGEGS